MKQHSESPTDLVIVAAMLTIDVRGVKILVNRPLKPGIAQVEAKA